MSIKETRERLKAALKSGNRATVKKLTYKLKRLEKAISVYHPSKSNYP